MDRLSRNDNQLLSIPGHAPYSMHLLNMVPHRGVHQEVPRYGICHNKTSRNDTLPWVVLALVVRTISLQRNTGSIIEIRGERTPLSVLSLTDRSCLIETPSDRADTRIIKYSDLPCREWTLPFLFCSLGEGIFLLLSDTRAYPLRHVLKPRPASE